jgi:hypothetical protein
MSHLDAQGEAHDALGTAVSSYGQRVLTDPHILGNLVTDLLPDLPRERSLLVTAAEAGIAAEMRQHVEEQHIDPDTAVQLVARALSERRAIDPAASMWVASEYAQALGYRVRPNTESDALTQPGPQVIPAAPTMTAVGPPAAQIPQAPSARPIPEGSPQAQSWPPPAQSWPPTQQPGQAQAWQPAQPQQPGQSWPPQGQAPGQSWPPAPQPGQSWPPAGPPGGRQQTSWSGRKRGLIAGGTAVGLVAIYLIVAAVAHVAPFATSKTVAGHRVTHTPTHPPTHPPTTHPVTSPPPTTAPALAAGVAPLVQLLPSDIDDPATQCTDMSPPFQWKMPGLVRALSCTDPGLPKGQIYAFQVNSYDNFLTTWKNYNKWWGIASLNPGSNCPPASGGAGTVGFHNSFFKSRPGQVLECETVGSGSASQPAYTWAYPTEDAFIVAQGADGSSFSALDKWWTSASGPSNSPSPSAS